MDDLRNVDPDDLSLLMKDVEKSFGFRFGKTSLEHVNTFGELCDVITGKLHERDVADCTTQQAFYKLRNALCATLSVERDHINTDTSLEELFSNPGRGQKIRAFHNQLGVKIITMNVKGWIGWTVFVGSILSIAGMFFDWQTALCVLLSFIVLYRVVSKYYATEPEFMTVGELAQKLASEHYLKARRNPDTVNRAEIEQKVRELFSVKLDLDQSVLTRDATWE